MRSLTLFLLWLPYLGPEYRRSLVRQYPMLERVPADRQIEVYLQAWKAGDAGMPWLLRRKTVLALYFLILLIQVFLIVDSFIEMSEDVFRLLLILGAGSLMVVKPILFLFSGSRRRNILTGIAVQMQFRCFESCEKCGYQIDPRSTESRCPECGASVLVSDFPQYAQIAAMLGKT